MTVQYGNELLGRTVEVVVDQDLVVAVAQAHLALGGMQAQLQGLGRLGTATEKTVAQDLERRGLDKDCLLYTSRCV